VCQPVLIANQTSFISAFVLVVYAAVAPTDVVKLPHSNARGVFPWRNKILLNGALTVKTVTSWLSIFNLTCHNVCGCGEAGLYFERTAAAV
jgi:hypothetical protein